jgi:hypothetical protein
MKQVTKILFFLLLFSADAFAQDSLNPHKQKQLAQIMENIRKPGFRAVDLFYFELRYFDTKKKNRLLEVLANKWTDEELIPFVKKYIDSDTAKQEQISIRAKELAERKKMPYQKIKDSLTSIEISRVKERTKQLRINDFIILLVGWLDMQEAIPVLRSALNDGKLYNNELVRLALARLLVEPYYSEALKKYSSRGTLIINGIRINDPIREYYEKAPKLIYIATQESIFAITDWFNRKEKVSPESHDDRLFSVAIYPTQSFIYLIDNESFQKNFTKEKRAVFLPSSITKSDIEFVKKWMLANKGKYEFDRGRMTFNPDNLR